jgi:hypothetical protein
MLARAVRDGTEIYWRDPLRSLQSLLGGGRPRRSLKNV